MSGGGIETTRVDPNSAAQRQFGGQVMNFLGGALQNPFGFNPSTQMVGAGPGAGGRTAPPAGNPFAAFLGGGPEGLANQQVQGVIGGLLGNVAGFQPQQVNVPDLMAQFKSFGNMGGGGGLGGVSRGFSAQEIAQLGQNVLQATNPIFEQNLQSSLGALSAAAPNVASTAFQQQGIDLGTQALRDRNAFMQQATQDRALQANQIQAQVEAARLAAKGQIAAAEAAAAGRFKSDVFGGLLQGALANQGAGLTAQNQLIDAFLGGAGALTQGGRGAGAGITERFVNPLTQMIGTAGQMGRLAPDEIIAREKPSTFGQIAGMMGTMGGAALGANPIK